MNRRPHGRKPTLALWMLVAIADLALFTAATGVLVMLTIVALLAVFAGGIAAARLISRRPEEAPARRRA